MDCDRIEDICRICLENNAEFNWNDEILEFPGVSYKNCYYKYTAMVEIDADFYPTKLCGRCAGEVKNAHILFEKALESFIILTNTVKAKERGVPSVKGSQKNRFQTGALERNCFQKSKNTQLCIDNFNIKKLLPSVINLKKSINNRKPFTTALELNLQLEICSSKLSKSTADKSAIKTFKPLKKDRPKGLNKTKNVMGATMVQSRTQSPGQSTLSKSSSSTENTEQPELAFTVHETLPQQSSFSIISPENTKTQQLTSEIDRTLLSDNNSISKISPDNTEREQLSLTKSFNKDDKEFELLNCFVSNPIPEGNDTNSFDYFTPLNETEPPNKQSDDILTPSKALPPAKKKSIVKEKICQYCSLKLTSTANLMRHEAIHVEHRERNFICPKCGIKLYSKLSLKEHLKTHIKNREKGHKCEFCEKAFFHKGALNIHRRVHLGLMVKCQMCPKEFYRKIDLERHLKSHSLSPLLCSSSKVVRYTVQCQYCNKNIQVANWKGHKAGHLKQPQWQCKICEKDFYHRNKCVLHLRKKHRISRSEYAKSIHQYDDNIPRTNHLMLEQQEVVLPIAQ